MFYYSVSTSASRPSLSRLRVIKKSHLKQRRLVSATSRFENGRILHHEWVVNGKVLSSKSSFEDDSIHTKNLQTVIFLHGLLGNGKNLRSPAKRLTEHHPNLKALLLDLRGHGQSSNNSNNHSFQNEHTIQNCALDIMETAKHLNLTGHTQSPIGIVGHSFGGRCALQYVSHIQTNHENNDYDIKPPKYTWLLDTVPGKAHSSVSNVIRALRNIDLSRIKSKQDLVQILTLEEKIEKSIAQWMTTNLKKVVNDVEDGSDNKRNSKNEQFEFMFDLETAVGVLDDFPKQDFMQMVDECTTIGNISHYNDDDKVYLVMAGKNKAWTNDIVAEFKSLEERQKLGLVTLTKAGHWVHVDDLDGLMDAMNSCFRNV